MDWLLRITPYWLDQNLTGNDTGDVTALHLHDGSVMGAWQTDHIALSPSQRSSTGAESGASSVTSRPSSRTAGTASPETRIWAMRGRPPPSCSGILGFVAAKQANVDKDQHDASNGEDHGFDDCVGNTEALRESIVRDRFSLVCQVAERAALRPAVDRQCSQSRQYDHGADRAEQGGVASGGDDVVLGDDREEHEIESKREGDVRQNPEIHPGR